MKTLEQLAEMTTGDLTAILPQIIIAEVETAARARRFGRALVKINTDLVGKQGRSINVPVRGTTSAARVAEGAELDATNNGSSPAYSTIPITPFKIVAYAAMTQESLDATEFDLIKDHIMEAGEALADLEDQEIIWEFLAKTAFSEVVAGFSGTAHNYALTHGKIFHIVSAQNDAGDDLTVNYVDYWTTAMIQIQETLVGDNLHITYWYVGSGRTQVYDATTVGVLAYEDIVKMGTAIRSAKFSPNFMVLNPEQMADLIKDNRFIDASRYGSTEALLTGEVGKIGAMKLLATTNIDAGTAFCVDSTRAAYLVIKRNVDLKRWDNPRSDAVELYFYFEFAPKVVNEKALAICLDMASNAKALS